jgi:hypothetical protein
LGSFGADKLDRLAGVVLAIELSDGGGGIGRVVTEFVLGFSGTVTGSDIVIPIHNPGLQMHTFAHVILPE